MLINIFIIIFLIFGLISTIVLLKSNPFTCLRRIRGFIKLNKPSIKREKYIESNKRTHSLLRKILPPQSKIYNFYEGNLLVYSRIGVYQLIVIKIVSVLFCLLLIILIRHTNISLMTNKVLNTLYYKTDVVFKNSKGYSAELEMDCFNKIIRNIHNDSTNLEIAEILNYSKERASHKIKLIVQQYYPNASDFEATANGIYYRLLDYYRIRKVGYVKCLIILICSFFLFDFILAIQKISFKIEKQNELNYLKKMVIINGSIKPINFSILIEALLSKAKYYKKIIEIIAGNTLKTEFDRTITLTQFVDALNTIDEKLFFEKLCEADTASFDASISIIKGEFEVAKRQTKRKIIKRVEQIHIAGIVGYMLIITLLIIYLIVPWTAAFDFGGGGNFG